MYRKYSSEECLSFVSNSMFGGYFIDAYLSMSKITNKVYDADNRVRSIHKVEEGKNVDYVYCKWIIVFETCFMENYM